MILLETWHFSLPIQFEVYVETIFHKLYIYRIREDTPYYLSTYTGLPSRTTFNMKCKKSVFDNLCQFKSLMNQNIDMKGGMIDLKKGHLCKMTFETNTIVNKC